VGAGEVFRGDSRVDEAARSHERHVFRFAFDASEATVSRFLSLL
jgi:hypothetical protein